MTKRTVYERACVAYAKWCKEKRHIELEPDEDESGEEPATTTGGTYLLCSRRGCPLLEFKIQRNGVLRIRREARLVHEVFNQTFYRSEDDRLGEILSVARSLAPDDAAYEAALKAALVELHEKPDDDRMTAYMHLMKPDDDD
jgi:hypothetical protein